MSMPGPHLGRNPRGLSPRTVARSSVGTEEEHGDTALPAQALPAAALAWAEVWEACANGGSSAHAKQGTGPRGEGICYGCSRQRHPARVSQGTVGRVHVKRHGLTDLQGPPQVQETPEPATAHPCSPRPVDQIYAGQAGLGGAA